jgi:uncharacterized protein
MKIKVSKIPEEGLVVDFDKEIDNNIGSTAKIVLKRMGAAVLLSGQVESEVSLECSRCLEGFTLSLSIPVDMTFCGEDPQHNEDIEFSEDENVQLFMDDEIDIGQLVEEYVLLNVPIKPLCSEKCKGLCPNCGTDLNRGKCLCQTETGDPRLQILSKLINKGD